MNERGRLFLGEMQIGSHNPTVSHTIHRPMSMYTYTLVMGGGGYWQFQGSYRIVRLSVLSVSLAFAYGTDRAKGRDCAKIGFVAAVNGLSLSFHL